MTASPSSAPVLKSTDSPRLALLVILAGVSAALHVGKLAPALPALQRSMEISLLQAGFLLSLVQLAGMTLGLFVGLSADHLGLRRSMILGLMCLFVAGVAGSWAQSAVPLLAWRAAEGCGFLMVVTPAPSLVRQLVGPARLSAMLGMWGAYMPLGSGMAMLIGPLLIDSAGWQGWWQALAAFAGLMALVLWRCVPPDATRRGRAPTAVPGQHVADGWWRRLRQTLGTRGPWLIALCFAMYSGQWLAVVGFLPSIYTQAGIAPAVTGVLTALVAGANMIGNIASGRLLQGGWPARRLLLIGYGTMAVGALLTFSDLGGLHHDVISPIIRYLAVLMFSSIGGLIPGTLFSLAVRLAPNETTVSTTVGWMQQLSAFGQFVGPPAVAWVAHWAGGWTWTWLVTGACSLVGSFLAVAVGRQLQNLPGRMAP